MPTTSFEIIGREAERESIESLLGRPRPLELVIEGEAGIGKSTLWAFAQHAATERGDRVLAWRASHAERELAFGALMGLLEADLESVLAVLPDARRRAIELALGRVDADGHAPEPGVVGLAVLDVLRALSAASPIVVGLDDAQWCDPASAGAIAFAARRFRSEPVAFVLAVRSGESASQAQQIEDAMPEDRRSHIPVGPMTIGALGRLIQERLNVAHPRPLLVRIHEASAGNPFVAIEMSRSLLSRGVTPAPGEPFPVSPRARPLVRDHLMSLSGPAQDALLVVAMASHPTVGLLDRVFGGDASVAIDEACQGGVLVAEGERLRAAHPLYASTAYADATPGRRRRLRRALADAVDDPLERAIQRAATSGGRDPALATEIEAGARLAVARGAPSLAADLFSRAAEIAQPGEAQPLLMEAAEARLQAGDAAGAAELLREILIQVAGGPGRARVLLALGEIVYLGSPSEALPILLEALDHTGDDPILEATVHIDIAVMSDADPSIGERSAHSAVEILERPGVEPDPELLGCALLERAYHWLLRGTRLALDDIDRAIAMVGDGGDSFIARSAQERAERCLYHTGRLRASLALDQAEHDRIVARGQTGLLPPIIQSMSVLEQLVGDWPAARRHARECLDLVEGGEEVWRERAMMAQGRVAAWDGDLDAARAIAVAGLASEEEAGDRWESVIFCALLGFVELSVPDPPAALTYLTRANAYADALEVRLPTVFRYLGDLVEAAVLAGDLALAEATLIERLESPAQRIPLPWVLEVSARGRGMLAARRGQLGDAVACFDRSLEVLDTTEMPFERGRTLLARGQVQLRAGHRRMARADLEAAHAIFTGLGAKAWTRRSQAELGRIGGRTSARWALTPSERSVAELAARGHSNREIADRLVLSVRTVESHLAATYRKLDVRSRVQLAGALVQAPDPPDPTP